MQELSKKNLLVYRIAICIVYRKHQPQGKTERTGALSSQVKQERHDMIFKLQKTPTKPTAKGKLTICFPYPLWQEVMGLTAEKKFFKH